jgi:serine/threonine protein kinase
MLESEDDVNWPIKIVDFGLSTIFGTTASSLCGTPIFMSPEIWQSKYYSESSDVWSCGILIFLLLNGSKCFSGINDITTLKKTIKEGKILDTVRGQLNFVSSDCLNILGLMLQNNYKMRSNIKELLSHKWFSIDISPSIPIDVQNSIIANMQAYKV